MDDLPVLRSLECVEALWRLGFGVVDSDDHVVRLARGGRRVAIRRHQVLTPNALRVILLTAGVTREELLVALARRGSGELRIDPGAAVERRAKR